ncbi:hypothetical protein ACFQH6_03760 [Halobacteriaceae archaeon GCM10025711]
MSPSDIQVSRTADKITAAFTPEAKQGAKAHGFVPTIPGDQPTADVAGYVPGELMDNSTKPRTAGSGGHVAEGVFVGQAKTRLDEAVDEELGFDAVAGEDYSVSLTGDTVTADLTRQGRKRKAKADAPFSGVPLLGEAFALGRGANFEYQEFTRSNRETLRSAAGDTALDSPLTFSENVSTDYKQFVRGNQELQTQVTDQATAGYASSIRTGYGEFAESNQAAAADTVSDAFSGKSGSSRLATAVVGATAAPEPVSTAVGATTLGVLAVGAASKQGDPFTTTEIEVPRDSVGQFGTGELEPSGTGKGPEVAAPSEPATQTSELSVGELAKTPELDVPKDIGATDATEIQLGGTGMGVGQREKRQRKRERGTVDPLSDTEIEELERQERNELARQGYEQTLYEQEREYGEVVREGIGEKVERESAFELIYDERESQQAGQGREFLEQPEEQMTEYQRRLLRGLQGETGAEDRRGQAEEPQAVIRDVTLPGTIQEGRLGFGSSSTRQRVKQASELESSLESDLGFRSDLGTDVGGEAAHASTTCSVRQPDRGSGRPPGRRCASWKASAKTSA